MSAQNQHLDALQDIRQMMQRSSRFISLSGLSGVAAGFWALAGAWFAHGWIKEYRATYGGANYTGMDYDKLVLNLVLLAGAVLGLAVISAFYFTYRRMRRSGVKLFDRTSRQLTVNMAIPLVAGGLFLLAMLQHNDWRFAGPGSLVFYGLALLNASKYTVDEIRWLGISEIVLGLVATQFIGQGLLFWAVGFGVLHIVYGFIMWNKYERRANVA